MCKAHSYNPHFTVNYTANLGHVVFSSLCFFSLPDLR